MTVTAYATLRENLARRDRSLREKVMSLEEAVSFVRDGDCVGIGGSTMSRTPMGLIWALIRAGRTKLSCARSIVSSDGDLLFASGACRPHRDELVQPGNPLGRVKSDAAPRGDGQRAIRGMEPPGCRHAVPGGRHGRALHADPLDARVGRVRAAAGSRRDDLPVHAGEGAAGAGAEPRRRADSRAARRRLRQRADRRTASSWISISRWRPTA